MKRFLLKLLFCAVIVTPSNAQERHEINIPDIAGYKLIKGDFHIHTVFSDGLVWPTVRVDEAYREGLDVIAICDHIEYRPHKDIKAHHGRSYEIAEKAAADKNILLVRGSEITRSMPPGHFNALFLDDCNLLDKKEWRDAFKEAKKQNAFMFWNHPGWARQQPDTTLWWKEHTEIYENGCMQGIEVANNGTGYMPEAHRWCLEKKLTMLGSTDLHKPSYFDYDFAKGEHRPMTFLLVKERSLSGVRDALCNRRTIVYAKDLLIGEEKYLRELFENSIEVISVNKRAKSCDITVKNNSDLTFFLKKTAHNKDIEYVRTMTLKPQSRHTITVYYPENLQKKELNFEVTNLLVLPNKGMSYSYSF